MSGFPIFYGMAASQAGLSPPSFVSIATGDSSDPGAVNNAVIVTGNVAGLIEDGSSWVGGTLTLDILTTATDTIYAFWGYLRSSGATSWAWDLDNFTFSWAGGSDPEVVGSAGTAQDLTFPFEGPIGKNVRINSAPSNGDEISFEIVGRATNAAGSTNALTLTIEMRFMNP